MNAFTVALLHSPFSLPSFLDLFFVTCPLPLNFAHACVRVTRQIEAPNKELAVMSYHRVCGVGNSVQGE